jgi:hypothetical protein
VIVKTTFLPRKLFKTVASVKVETGLVIPNVYKVRTYDATLHNYS